MKNNTILTYDDVRAIRSGDSDEKLMNVRDYDNSITAQYEKFDMVAYTGLEILVRETVAKKLAIVNRRLKNKYDLALKVVYGYRALEVQENYFNARRAKLRIANPELSPEELVALTHNFVAAPEVAGHVTGGAVDITLVDSGGVACDMGTRVADFADEDRIKTFAAEITANQRRLRQILLDEMVSVGFAPFLGEWWHFSYGDKEWAAYYQKPSALYGPLFMKKTATVLRIAGGNETSIQVVKGGIKEANEQAGKALLNAYPIAEQAGLLYIDSNTLEMAGGEFCGNASTAAAVLLADESTDSMVRYVVSGFKGDVAAEVMLLTDNKYRVRTSFNGMSYMVENMVYEGKQLYVVDMRGITHVLIEDDFPVSNCESLQRKLVNELNLGGREAVGVIWYKQQAEGATIHPVVWVKKADTLFYESSCGSGSIAVALCTGSRKILQPTREYINVYINQDNVTTECEVTVIG